MLRRIWGFVDPRGRGALSTYARVALFWNPLVAALFVVVFAERGDFWEQLAMSLVIATVSLTVAFAAVFAANAVDGRVRRTRGLPERKQSAGRGIFIAAMTLPLGVYLGYSVVFLALGEGWPEVSSIGYGIIVGIVALLSFSLFETLADLRAAKHLAELKERDAETARLRGQLAVLTAQMNPHLLFNTLNTIASLTQTDADAAEETTVELASLYRGVLDASRRERHTLADELEICSAYLAIEKARFGDRLRWTVDLDVDDPKQLLVPPLLLQPLVENAVKHGIGPKEEGGEVKVSIRTNGTALHLAVRDDGVGFDAGRRDPDRANTGLDNCRQRLALLHADAATLEIVEPAGGGTDVRIQLPIVRGAEGDA